MHPMISRTSSMGRKEKGRDEEEGAEEAVEGSERDMLADLREVHKVYQHSVSLFNQIQEILEAT